MEVVDALCLDCGKPIRWTAGASKMVCEPCRDKLARIRELPREVAVDVTVTFDGSMYAFDLRTPAVREWVEEYVWTNPWQWLGNGLCLDHHIGEWFIGQLASEGFIVEVR